MSGPTWFKFFGSEYLLDAKVDALPLEAQGILVRLWCLCSRDGAIIDDPKTLARRAGVDLSDMKKHWPQVRAFFEIKPDGLHSTRMENEIEGYEEICTKRRERAIKAGLASAAKRASQVQPDAPVSSTTSSTVSSTLSSTPSCSEVQLKSTEAEAEAEEEKDKRNTPPTPRKRGRKPKEPEVVPREYPPATVAAVNQILQDTPREDSQDRKIRRDPATLAVRVDALLRENSTLTPDLLVQAWQQYLATNPTWIKAPHYFFGHKDDQKDGAHWHAYAALIWHLQSKSARQSAEQQPEPVAS